MTSWGCAQHDILWDDLTAQEHLETFGMFRGRKLKDLAPIIAGGGRRR